MQEFDKQYQLWLPQGDGTYGFQEFDTLREALTADRLENDEDWYITERISADEMEMLVGVEMRGNPVIRQDKLGKLSKTYQLWSGDSETHFTLGEHANLLPALGAPRRLEYWRVTQVVKPPEAASSVRQ